MVKNKNPIRGFFCGIHYIYLYTNIMMKDIIKKRLNEEFTKGDFDKNINTFIDSTSFKGKVEKIVKDRIKNEKELEDKVVEITTNVITQLYKTLWTKRGFWRSQLKNKAS